MVNNINGNSFHKKREDFNNSEILSKSSSYNARERELYNVPCLRPVVVMRDVVARTKCVDEVCVCVSGTKFVAFCSSSKKQTFSGS